MTWAVVLLGSTSVRSASSVHVGEQRSPAAWFPSSHSSPAFRWPLPHAGTQTEGSAVPQSKPGSVWQVGSQPSPAVVLWSSHCSAPSSVPLPHASEHTDGLVVVH